MYSRLTRIVRLVTFFSVSLVFLQFATVSLAPAATIDLKAEQDTAIKHYHSGKVVQAISKLEHAIEGSQGSATPEQLREVYALLLDICTTIQDVDCVGKHLQGFLDIPDQDANDNLKRTIAGQKVYYIAFMNFLAGNRKEIMEYLAKGMLVHGEPFVPNLYINSQLLAARFYLAERQYAEARIAVDKALSLILSLPQPQSFYLATWLSEIIAILNEAGDTSRAIAIYDISKPFIDLWLPQEGPDLFNFRYREVSLLGSKGLSNQAENAARDALAHLVKLELPEQIRLFWMSVIYIDLVAYCLDKPDGLECAKDASSNNPLLKNTQLLVQNGTFVSWIAMVAVVAEIYRRNSANETIPESWVVALDHETHFPGIDDRLMNGIRLTGRGLARVASDSQNGATDLASGAREQLAYLDERLAKAGDGFPLLPYLDRLILTIGLVAVVSGKAQIPDRDALALKIIEALNRSYRYADSDALALIADMPTLELKRLAHARYRLTSRQAFFERQRLAQVLVAVGQGQQPPGADSTKIYDWDLRSDFAKFGILRGKLNTVLEERAGGVKRSLPDIETLQKILGPNEAFLTQSVFLDGLAHLCVRKDRVFLEHTQVDLNSFNAYVKFLGLALTATHPPDQTLDSQYPVDAAVYLYESLIKPAEPCLQGVNHLIWAGGTLRLPIGALLTEPPPKKGEGYNLREAKWLIRRFSVSIVPSAAGLIAARKISPRTTTDLPFLGIGDPVLTSGVNAVAPASAPEKNVPLGNVKLADLPELPDTGFELLEIQKIIGGRAKILVRNNAQEINFRREPLDRYAVLDFATHGLLRAEVQGLNEAALVLTPGQEDYSLNDGLLTASEIADLNLNARLVVLSACNTANFDIDLFGSEVQGLTTAFALAGVPATLVTLWPVETKTSRIIMTAFFKNLFSGRGQTATHSLSKATLDFIENPPNPAYAHPRFWAPFIVFGDGAALSRTADRPNNRFELRDLKVGSNQGGGEVFRISAAPRGNVLYLNGYAGLENRRYKSFLTRLNTKGESEWTFQDNKVGVTHALVPLADGALFAGYLSGPQNSMDTVMLKIGLSGKELWRKAVDFGGKNAFPIGGARLEDNRVVIGVLVSDRVNEGNPNNTIVLIVLSENGDELNRIELPLENNYHFPVARLFVTDQQLVVTATERLPGLGKSYRNDYDDLRVCFEPSFVKLWLLAPSTLEVLASHEYRGFEPSGVLQQTRGELLVAGTFRDPCDLHTSAAVVAIDPDGKISNIFVDSDPFDSSGKTLLRLRDGNLLLLGESNRAFNIVRHDVLHSRVEKNMKGIEIDRLYGEELSDAFLLEMNKNGAVRSQTWLQMGGPVWIMDGLLVGNDLFVGGAATGEVMYARFEIH